LKDEIVEIEDKIENEKHKAVEIKGIKNKTNHQLYKIAEDNERLNVK
jgi:hypothetical protein